MNVYLRGSTDTHWANVAQSANEMTDKCDANFEAAAAVDYTHVEYSVLGPDQGTILSEPQAKRKNLARSC